MSHNPEEYTKTRCEKCDGCGRYPLDLIDQWADTQGHRERVALACQIAVLPPCPDCFGSGEVRERDADKEDADA